MSALLISVFSFLVFLAGAQVLWAIKGHPDLGGAFATCCIACAISIVAIVASIARLASGVDPAKEKE